MNHLFRRRISLVALGFSLPLVAFWWKNRLMPPDPDFASGIPGLVPPGEIHGNGLPHNFPPDALAARPAPPVSRLTRPVVAIGPPVLSLQAVKLQRFGPLYGQNKWLDEDCSVEATLQVANVVVPELNPFSSGEGSGSSDPNALKTAFEARIRARRELNANWGLRGADGKPLLQQPVSVMVTPRNRFFENGAPILNRESRVPGVTYGLQARFDLDRVPVSDGVVTLGTQLKISHSAAVPFAIEVRPAWFEREPRTLRLESARWRANARGDDGAIVVKVRERGARVVLQNEPEGSVVAWQVAFDGKTRRTREIISERKLLYNWSPRLESEDGNYNSHAARDAQAWISYRKATSEQGNGAALSETQKSLASFSPKIEAQTPIRDGDLITLVYRVFGWKNVPGAPVFKTEIGVPGDGFLKVSAPLPRGSSG